MICAARSAAQAVSATKWSVRPERSEDAQMIATGPTNSGVCAVGARQPVGGTVSPAKAASGGVAEPGFR